MTVSHTPGPWFQDRYGNINDKTGSTIRVVGLALSSGNEAKANSRLIVAAPDLLYALEFVMERLVDHNENDPAAIAARAAITKATEITT